MRRTIGGLSLYESPDNDSLIKKRVRSITNGLTITGSQLTYTDHHITLRIHQGSGKPRSSPQAVRSPPHMYLAFPCLYRPKISTLLVPSSSCDSDLEPLSSPSSRPRGQGSYMQNSKHSKRHVDPKGPLSLESCEPRISVLHAP